MPDSAQGTDVSFGGASIGSLTGFRCTPAEAVYSEVTSFASAYTGSGDNFRVWKTYVCTAIEPGTVEVSLYGAPPYSPAGVGDKAALVVGSFASGDAYLDSYEITGQVGEFLKGTARFRFVGG